MSEVILVEGDERLHALVCPPEPGCSWIPNELIRDKRLSVAGMVIGAMIACWFQSEREGPLTVEWLMRSRGTTRQQVMQALSELEASGWIRVRQP